MRLTRQRFFLSAVCSTVSTHENPRQLPNRRASFRNRIPGYIARFWFGGLENKAEAPRDSAMPFVRRRNRPGRARARSRPDHQAIHPQLQAFGGNQVGQFCSILEVRFEFSGTADQSFLFPDSDFRMVRLAPGRLVSALRLRSEQHPRRVFVSVPNPRPCLLKH